MSKHILLVDDDTLMRRSLAFNLEKAGFKTSSAANAEDALVKAQREMPDLVLLDIGLPGMDGLDALRQIKDKHNIPVIFLTARRRELDEVLGLEMGADDYVTKPFDFDVLLAHIKAVLRRSTQSKKNPLEASIISVGDLWMDPSAHVVTIKGQVVGLTPRKFDLLHVFAINPQKVLSVYDLIVHVWGAEYIGQPQVVYVHIRWLRKKIEKNPDQPERIITIRGVGYKFEPTEN